MMTQNSPGIPKRSTLLQVLLRQLVPNLGTIVVVAAMLFAYSAQASSGISPDVPADPDVVAGSIPYQGTLTDKDGNPVNGTVTITFRLYTSPTGGTALWEETQNVKVSNGLFNAYLGSLTPILGSTWEQPDLYLGVQVGSDSEMIPRELVSGLPMNLLEIHAGVISEDIFSPGWVLHQGTGERHYTVHIDFESAFTGNPTVLVSLSSFDIANTHNSLLRVYPTNITTSGFDLNFMTWSDSQVFGASASWVAFDSP